MTGYLLLVLMSVFLLSVEASHPVWGQGGWQTAAYLVADGENHRVQRCALGESTCTTLISAERRPRGIDVDYDHEGKVVGYMLAIDATPGGLRYCIPDGSCVEEPEAYVKSVTAQTAPNGTTIGWYFMSPRQRATRCDKSATGGLTGCKDNTGSSLFSDAQETAIVYNSDGTVKDYVVAQRDGVTQGVFGTRTRYNERWPGTSGWHSAIRVQYNAAFMDPKILTASSVHGWVGETVDGQIAGKLLTPALLDRVEGLELEYGSDGELENYILGGISSVIRCPVLAQSLADCTILWGDAQRTGSGNNEFSWIKHVVAERIKVLPTETATTTTQTDTTTTSTVSTSTTTDLFFVGGAPQMTVWLTGLIVATVIAGFFQVF